jgi:hypothetical protein
MVVDSQQQELSVPEIIRIAAQETKSKYAPSAVLASITKECQMPQTILLRYGNTLFIINKGKNRKGFFRALNADTARNYMQSSLTFIAEAYEIGFDVLVTQFEDPSLLSIFRFIAKDQPADMGYQVKQADGIYNVTVILGPRRQGEE